MFVYSEKIVRFVVEVKNSIKTILTHEVGLKVRGERFYNERENFSYPIKIVIFKSSDKLGFFDTEFLELGFHESVILSSKNTLLNLIRHELAHYLTFIKYGKGIIPHGAEFRETCKNLNWGKDIYEASTSLDRSPFLVKSTISRKIEKLIALGSSSNPYESSLAIIKSRELLLKHNILESFSDEGRVFLLRVLKEKKLNAKMQSIGHILKTFFVSTVYSYSSDYVYLEIIGSALNIEIAGYIASILDLKLDSLWQASNLSGLSSKNSFFDGIAKGYCKKIEELNNQCDHETSKALLKIENCLSIAKSVIYPRLSQSKSFRKVCPLASTLGEKAGKNLEFKKGLPTFSKTIMFLEKKYK